MVTRMRRGLALAALWAVLGGGCAGLDPVAGLEATGYPARLAALAGRAVGTPADGPEAAGSLEPAAGPAPLDQVGVPLRKLADGVVAGPRAPDVVGGTAAGIARRHGPALAGRMAVGALTGGLGVAGDLPSGARKAAEATAELKAATDEQRALDEAYAEAERTREATALVPDRDRPAEATAMLRIADGSQGAAADWSNAATGASGRVELGPAVDAQEGAFCRAVLREYRHERVERKGKGLICRQDGVWYDLG